MSSQSSIYNPTERTLSATGDGFSFPRLTTAGRTAIVLGPSDKGMMVYDTTVGTLCLWNGTTWEFISDSSSGVVNVKDFGAVGNGIADDTAAIKAAIASIPSGGTVLFPFGNYLITSTQANPILISQNGVNVIGNNATISNGANRSFATFVIAGTAVIIDGMTFDGKNTSLNTLLIDNTAKQVVVRNCEIKNSKQQAGDATYAVGILVKNGTSDITIDNCYIHNIDAPITGVARGILATQFGSPSTFFKDLTISNCFFEDISPDSDGDGIVLQPLSYANDVDSNVINCRFNRCEKRAIKIQANNVNVIGCHVTLPSNGFAGISIYGDRCKVIGSTITGGYSYIGIEVGVPAGVLGNQTVIDGVIINMTSIVGNFGIRFYGNINDLTVSNSTLSNLLTGIEFANTGSRANVIGNTLFSINQNAIHNAGSAGTGMSQLSVVSNQFSSITAFTIRNDNGLQFSAIGNVTDGSGFGVGGSATGVRATYFSNQISGQPVQTTGSAAPVSGTWSVGDVVWNTSPISGGYAGWICVAAGTPGTWKTFGLIS